jgi:DNA polymerase-3 subunit beta
LLEANGQGSLRLRATDNELAIEREIGVAVTTPGSVTLPAKVLQEIVSALPEGEVCIGVDEQSAGTITCGKSRTRIHGLPPEDYPPISAINGGHCFQIEEGRLRVLVQRVISSIAKDDLLQVLAGALFEMKDSTLRLISTDNYRMTVATSALVEPTDDAQWIIPGRALRELLNLLAENSAAPVTCQFDNNQAQFVVGSTALTTRLIEGKFPNWRRQFSEGWAFRLTLDATLLIQAVKRVAIVAREDASRLYLEADGNTLELAANAGLVGTCRDEVACDREGEKIRFAVNVGYLLQGLEAVGGDRVALDGTAPLRPLVLRAAGDETCRVLLMPMSVTDLA